MGFYALSAAWLFTLLVPLVILYFLKLKRPRQVIPSLVLWQQVMQDQRVNSPFQKFKRNLLLLLQILLLCLLALAAMQPYWRGEAGGSDRLLVMIDHSASMGAMDKRGGSSRLDEARRRTRQLIDAMAPDQEMALIAFSSSARQLADFTSNKRVLHEALEHLEVQDVPSQTLDALRMAEAMARSTGFDRAIMLTDGVLGEGSLAGGQRVLQLSYQLPFTLDYQKLPEPGVNIGITAVSAQRSVNGDWNLFAKVQGAGTPGRLELTLNGNLVGSEHVVVNSPQGQRFMFPVPGDQAASVELRLRPDDFDALAADNVAYLELKPTRPLRVYVSPALVAFRHALAVHERLAIYPEEGETSATGPFDLAIVDGAAPPTVEAAVTLTVGHIPEGLASLLELQSHSAHVVDWNRASPLLEHVELSEVVILDDVHWSSAQREGDMENRGYEVLVYGEHGPLIIQRREGQRVDYHLLFHTDRSTLPFRVGFPILTANLLRQASLAAGLLETPAPQTGVLPPAQLVSGATYRVEGPGNLRRTEQASQSGVLSGVPAPLAGRYSIIRDGQVAESLGVSLLSPSESLLESVDAIEFPEQSVAASAAPTNVNRAFWWTLAAIGLGVMLIEWWFYQRRPGGIRT